MNSKSESTEIKPPIFHSDRFGVYLSSNEEFQSFLEFKEKEDGQGGHRFTKSLSDFIAAFAKDAFQDKLIVRIEFTTEPGFIKKRSVFFRKIFK
ncbi:hypothetical protein, partial [Leptospira ellisii]